MVILTLEMVDDRHLHDVFQTVPVVIRRMPNRPTLPIHGRKGFSELFVGENLN